MKNVNFARDTIMIMVKAKMLRLFEQDISYNQLKCVPLKTKQILFLIIRR